MSGIVWRDAESEDRVALEQFTCTVKADRRPDGRPCPHPPPWEAEAQVGVRQRKPPGPREDVYRVGVGSDGAIAAVSVTGAVIDPDFDPTFKLLVLAVSISARGQRGHVADDCMLDALTQMEHLARSAAASQFLVIGYIDPRNRASRQMCQRQDFHSDRPGRRLRGLEPLVLVETTDD